MINIDNLTFSYRRGFEAIKDVTVAFNPGIHLLLGPNGSGKTTLLNLMAGLLVPQEGWVLLDDFKTSLHNPRVIKQIFYLPEDTRFPLDTINEMVRYHSVFYPRFSRETLYRNLAAFGMTGDEKLKEMSLGTMKKANLAYAIALGTEVLLLDEPANALDIGSKQRLTTMIAEAADDNRYIFVATHTVQEMAHLFDSVTILKQGELVLSAATCDLEARLAFVTDSVARPDAIYTDSDLSGNRMILPNDGTMETMIDFYLLYSAATSPDNSLLISTITRS